MKKILIVGCLVLIALFTTPVTAQMGDCFWLQISLNYQTGQRDFYNNDLAYWQLAVSWDILDGRGPGDPVFDYDVRQCVIDGGFADYWQGEIDATGIAMDQAHCY